MDRECNKCGLRYASAVHGGTCPNCLLSLGLGGADLAEQPASDFDYELGEEIGRGGMGVVFKARQKSLNRFVAIKMIKVGRFASPQLRERFRREAEAAAKLSHPQIVAIHEVGEKDGEPFYSMELVEGGSLRKRIETGLPLPGAAVRDTLLIAKAIQFAHAHGILHRDVTPPNVLIDAGTDLPKVVDFGLAKIDEADGLTEQGQPMGSPGFRSPEMAMGRNREITVASDVYSLGAVLYFLLTGNPPFPATSDYAAVQKAISAEPESPRKLRPDVNLDLETICLKCLHKEPAKRYASVTELVRELERWERGEPVAARPVGPLERGWRWMRRNPAKTASFGTILAVLVASAALMIGHSASRRAAKLDARAEVKQADDALGDALNSGGTGFGLAHLAQAVRLAPRDPVANSRLYSLLTCRNHCPVLAQLVHTNTVSAAEFSPDSRRLFTISSDAVTVWDASTGHLFFRIPSGSFPVARFSPDGIRLAVAGGGMLRLWQADTGQQTDVEVQHAGRIRSVQFSEDGQRFVTASDDYTARVWETASGRALSPPMQHTSPVTDAWLAHDGQRVITASLLRLPRPAQRITDYGRLILLWDLQTGQQVGTSTLVNYQVNTVELAPDESRVVCSSSSADDAFARIWDLESGQSVGRPLRHRHLTPLARFSPDGSRVVTVSQDKTARFWDAATGEPLDEPIAQGFQVSAAAFSPDGWLLATGGDATAVWLWDARTGLRAAEPLQHPADIDSIVFAPDGQRLATVCADNVVRIWDVREGRALPLTLDQEATLLRSFSPDGRRLAIIKGSNVQVRAVDSTNGLLILPHGSPVALVTFSPDSTHLAVGCNDHTAWVWRLSGTAQLVVGPLKNERPISSLQLSPAAQWLAISSGDIKAVRQHWVWNVATGKLAFPPFQSGFTIPLLERLTLDPTGRWLAALGDDDPDHHARTGRLIELGSGRTVTNFVHPNYITSLRFSADGERLAVASKDKTVQIIESSTGRAIVAPLRHNDVVNAASFSPDGAFVLTAAKDKTARVWQLADGRLRFAPISHSQMPWDGRFSPNGQRIGTGSYDFTAQIWDADSGEALWEPLIHEAPVVIVGFTPDGEHLLTHYGEVERTDPHGKPLPYGWRLWETPTVPLPAPAWLPRLAEAVGGLRLNDQGVADAVAADELAKLRRELSSGDSAAGPFYSAWVRWFLADRSVRTLSPFLNVTVSRHIQDCLEMNTTASLEMAARLAPTNAQVLTRLALKRATDRDSASRGLVEADFLSARATRLAPTEPAAWAARAEVCVANRRLEEALAALRRAGQAALPDARFRNRLGELFASRQRLEEALEQFGKALEALPASRNELTSRIRLNRSDAWRRLGRLDNASAERGMVLGLAPRDSRARSNQLDLALFYSTSLSRRITAESEQAPFAPLPSGLIERNGIAFDVRGAIEIPLLTGFGIKETNSGVAGIPLGTTCRQLHILHSAYLSDGGASDGAAVGGYVLHYEDGERRELPLLLNEDTRAWRRPVAATNSATRAALVFASTNALGEILRIYHRAYANPRPDVPVRTLDIVSRATNAAPLVFAITVE